MFPSWPGRNHCCNRKAKPEQSNLLVGGVVKKNTSKKVASSTLVATCDMLALFCPHSPSMHTHADATGLLPFHVELVECDWLRLGQARHVRAHRVVNNVGEKTGLHVMMQLTTRKSIGGMLQSSLVTAQ